MDGVGSAKEKTYRPETLHRFAQSVFETAGMRSDDAGLLASHLVWAEARGISWLGLQKIPQYLGRLREGATPPAPAPQVVRDTPAVHVVDCGGDWAIVTGHRVMEALVSKARESGVAIGLLRNASAAGALGYYADLAVQSGAIGMAITNSAPLVAPPGSAAKAIGNQAFAVGAPAGRHPPLLLDMATSAVTLARLHDLESRGQPAPEGAALDSDGAPTVDPTAALAGVLLPMAGHRGFGLSLMWEVLTGVLSGSDKFAGDVRMPGDYDGPQNISLFLLAIDPTIVVPSAEFRSRVDALIDAMEATPPLPGNEPVRVPGARSQALGSQRLRDGIPLPASLVAALAAVGRELGVPWT